MDNKKQYSKPTMTEYKIETNRCLLQGSVELKTVEFKGHTESYESETFDWDNITFE